MATTTGALAFFAFASASASIGRLVQGVASLTGLDLHKFGEHLTSLGGGEAGHGLPLGFEAEAGAALLYR